MCTRIRIACNGDKVTVRCPQECRTWRDSEKSVSVSDWGKQGLEWSVGRSGADGWMDGCADDMSRGYVKYSTRHKRWTRALCRVA